MSKIVWSVVIFTTVATILLIYTHPSIMLSAGKPIKGHERVEDDCLACHQPLKQNSSIRDQCTKCHRPKQIGIATVNGKRIIKSKSKSNNNLLLFHTRLKDDNCSACHKSHLNPNKFKRVNLFSHRMLSVKDQNSCSSCHSYPKDKNHQQAAQRECYQCHLTRTWQQVVFDHQRLKDSGDKTCIECHNKPKNSIHSPISSNRCLQCHKRDRWLPSTFNHQKYFRFDRKHRANDCQKCHPKDNYQQYSCYGCHKHRRAKVRREHEEEGIYKFQNCIQCHRSADEDEAERIWEKLRKKMRKSR
jgi:hypothetical protein